MSKPLTDDQVKELLAIFTPERREVIYLQYGTDINSIRDAMQGIIAAFEEEFEMDFEKEKYPNYLFPLLQAYL